MAFKNLVALHRARPQVMVAADDIEMPARLALPDGQRQAPVALLADHPIVHVAQPVHLAVIAKFRMPVDLIHDIHDLIAQAGLFFGRGHLGARLVIQLAHADEPLVHQAEDQLLAAAPAGGVAVAVALRAVEDAFGAQTVEDRPGHLGHMLARQPGKAVHVDAVFIERRDHGQLVLLAQPKVFRAAAWRNVHNAGAFFFAHVLPGDDAVPIRAAERLRGRGQLVKRAAVFPAEHLRAFQHTHDLELALERALDRTLRQIVGPAVILRHLDVGQRRAHGRGDIAGQRPGRGCPHQERFPVAPHQRELEINRLVRQFFVAVSHDLVLADAGAAAIAPRHDIGALVEPTLVMALLEEAPDHVVVFVAEREVGAADVRHAQPPNDLLDRIGHRAVCALNRRRLSGVFAEQAAQAPQLGWIVPVHPVAQADGLIGLHRGKFEHAHLAQLDEFGQAKGLNVALALEAQFFFDIHLNPQALAVEAVLPALVVALHRVETLEEVFVRAPPGVVDAHRIVGRNRAIEEAPAFVALAAQPA